MSSQDVALDESSQVQASCREVGSASLCTGSAAAPEMHVLPIMYLCNQCGLLASMLQEQKDGRFDHAFQRKQPNFHRRQCRPRHLAKNDLRA